MGSSGRYSQVGVDASGRSMIAGCWDGRITTVLVGGSSGADLRRITTHGDAVSAVAMDASGERIATGDSNGAVRVGRATGEEPHLLLGHSDLVTAVALSPDGRWIASASGDEIFLWPMPDLKKPPLHTLPHNELIAKLGSLTNLRAVRDDRSSTGWTIEFGPSRAGATSPPGEPNGPGSEAGVVHHHPERIPSSAVGSSMMSSELKHCESEDPPKSDAGDRNQGVRRFRRRRGRRSSYQ